MNRRYSLMLPAGLLLLGFIASSQSVTLFGKPSALDRAKAGKALWQEKCRTVAGEKIFRKVENVEGLLLLKVRPQRSESELADPMWPDAAFAREARTDEYITTFLGYERAATIDGKPLPITQSSRGFVDTTRDPQQLGRPGYRYVDVIEEKDGKRYRYTGSEKVVGRKDTNALGVQMALQKDPNYDLNVYRWTLDKALAPDPAPRYGVTYEDHVIPEDRAFGVASSTVKVLDLEAKEVLGKMIRYAWSVPSSPANPSPWLTALRCPDHAYGSSASTRKFVDQILIPAKEK